MRAIDRSAHTNRWRHWPAAEKLVVCTGLMLVSLLAAGWAGQVIILAGLVAALLAGARVRPGDLARAAMVPVGFIATSTLAQMVTLDLSTGWPVFGIAGPEARLQALFVGQRSLTCVTALLALALTTPLTSILQLFQRRGLAGDIGDIALMMFRIIWLVLDCLEAGQRAQAARLGHEGARRMIRSNGRLLACLLPRVLDRAQRMNTGLGVRGYDGTLRFVSVEAAASAPRIAGLCSGLVVLALGLAQLG
ncbi:cobalt ECF transporter T component CbiQ [Tistrella bauzanensis]|uniref:Cobalt ECF transporter T component CbiQ n=1 Tax=Tistrella bauzanensis TaxID=657419 RepID=A0ABQ1J497_9PROT|nr:CbiQ family ECF transporter T component [Tistrella bauzanensis]GGB59403.1 cobalt ECF transporter T component CbiQ [Tistrella bauzanensis]